MDKYEYKVRADEIKSLIAKGDYVKAAEIADTIDWRRIKSVMMLCTISDLYKINRRYEDARDMLLLAYDRRPGGRTICYSLCELSVKTEDIVQAIEFYKEFVQVAPADPARFILQYKIYEAQDVSLEERIEVLEELKKRDYREKWAYELAYLYHRIGLATRCVEECDELILWFGEGKYVIKAMELKMLHQPLNAQQQEKYDHRFDGQFGEAYGGSYTEDAQYDEGESEPVSSEQMSAQPEEAQMGETRVFEAIREEQASADEEPVQEQDSAVKEDTDELDIHVKTLDFGEYNTMNLQAEIAAGLQEVLSEDAQGEPSKQAPAYDQETESLDGIQFEDIGEEEMDSYETGEIDGAGEAQPRPVLSESEVSGYEIRDYSEETENFEMPYGTQMESEVFFGETGEIVTPVLQQEIPVPSGIANVLSQESDGQIGFIVPETEKVEKQITGQMNIEDILAEWERMKKETQERQVKEIRQRVLQHTGEMFTEFEAATRDGLLEKLEKESMAGARTPDFSDAITDQSIVEEIAQRTAMQQENQFYAKEGDLTEENLADTAPEDLLEGDYPAPAEGTALAEELYERENAEGEDYYEEETAEGGETYEEEPVEGEEYYEGEPVEGEEYYEEEPVEGEEYYEEEAAEGEEYYEEEAAEGEEYYEEEPVEGEEYYEEEAAEGEEYYEEEAAEGEEYYEQEPAEGEEYYEEEPVEGEEYYEEEPVEGEEYYEEEAAEGEEYYEEEAVEGEEYYEEELAEEAEEAAGTETAAGEEETEETEETSAITEPEEETIVEEEAEEAAEPIEAEEAAGTETAAGEEEIAEPEEETVVEDETEEAAEPAEEETAAGEEETAEPAEPEAETVVEDETEEAKEPTQEEATEPEEEVAAEEESAETETAEEETAAGEEEPAETDEPTASRKEPGRKKKKHKKKKNAAAKTQDGAENTKEPEQEPEEEKERPIRHLTDEEKELYEPFIQSPTSKEQLVHAIDNISMASYTGNLIITGEDGLDTITLAKNVVKEIRETDSNFSGKVAKISGNTLNQKDVTETLERFNNGALIIEKSSEMNEGTVQEMYQTLQKENMGIVVIMEDDKRKMNRFLNENEQLNNMFTARIDVEALSNDALVQFGKKYANELEFSIDDLGTLALHTRIETMQTSDHIVTVTEVKEIVDGAIAHARRKTMGHFFDILLAKRYDAEDMIILSEKDFV